MSSTLVGGGDVSNFNTGTTALPDRVVVRSVVAALERKEMGYNTGCRHGLDFMRELTVGFGYLQGW